MKSKSRQSGVTLTEMTVVVGVVVVLVAIGLPAIDAFHGAFESEGSVRALISAGLTTARTVAAREQRYAGIRFQEDLAGNQYMTFIIQDSRLGAFFFRAVEGIEPIRLPENFGVMDFTIVVGHNIQNPVNPDQEFRLDDPSLSINEKNNLIADIADLTDTTTFSIVFAPNGRLVTHGVRVRNRDGASNNTSADVIFNTNTNVDAGIGMFYQDDYFEGPTNFGLGPEPSRRAFVIYDKTRFDRLNLGSRWSDYLVELEPIYINPYTGQMISVD
jgi:type II secretory pathway pseudopilin PulG